MGNYKLQQRDRDLLACIELNADRSVSSVARRLGVRTHTAQYLLTKLKDRGVFTRSSFIDIHRLGYRWCGVFFSVRASGRKRDALFKYLIGHERTGWFAELGGAFGFGIAIAVVTPKEAEDFLNRMIQETGVLVYKKAVAFRLTLTDTARGYLSSKQTGTASFSMEDGVESIAVDHVDHRILAELARSPDSSFRKMAVKLNLPHTTFDLRVKRLKEKRIIVGSGINIDPQSLGRQSYKILLFMKGKDIGLTARLKNFAISNPVTVHFVECFGNWDYELNIEAESLREVAGFTDLIQNEFGESIIDVATLNIAQVHKLSRYPFAWQAGHPKKR